MRRKAKLLLPLLLGLIASPAAAEIRIELEGDVEVGSATGIAVSVLGEGDFALGGALPRAWLVPEPEGACAPPSASVLRSELDGWLIILRNSDNTITAVDPERALASGNIVWLTPASRPIERWQVDGDGGIARLWHTGLQTAEVLNLSDGSLVDAGNLKAGERSGLDDPLSATSSLAQRDFRLEPASGRILSSARDASVFAPFVDLRAPAQSIAVSPDGRWLFALSPEEGLVQVVDLALGRQTRALLIHAGFTHTAFTDDYLYLREAERAYVSMIRLTSLAEDKEHVVAIPVGLLPSDDPMAPIGTDGMAFLSSQESAVYLYMESGMSDGHGTMRSPTEMLAPYDVVRIRGSHPVDIGVYDRSLREVRPGQFRTSISPPHGGNWRLVVRDRQSEQIGCLDFEVEGPAMARQERPAVELIGSGGGDAVFSVAGADSAQLPPRLAMLAIVPGTNWQRRINAVRTGDASYRVEETLPRGQTIMLVPSGLPYPAEPVTIGPLP
ncbi:hypothetical protein [Aurantiacibacter rhizosphaerae]|uniref:WD40 repeat domain-containing protein n=1 Tax=Aurantiacibacter rhizosphaerae TaxID=2691582 RepID=A0A844XGH3_9SPHN|nr:hypothetical protein [Aurantiacibacter rhizosphaerae]MWV28678.1 hypothetical protein [Aurantiacibacter rhizosphaerae]